MTKDELEKSVKRYENSSGKFSFKNVETDPETNMFCLFSFSAVVAVWLIGTLIAYITANEWNWAHVGLCSLVSFVPFVFSLILFVSLLVEKKQGFDNYNHYKKLLNQVDNR